MTSSIRLSEREVRRRLRQRHRLAKEALKAQHWGLKISARNHWLEVDRLDREIAEACR